MGWRDSRLWPGRILLALLVVFLIWRLRRPPRLDPWILVPLAAALTFWVLVALVLSDVRPLAASRYFLPGAFFLLLIVAAALHGLNPPRWALPVGAAVLIAAAVPNVVNYVEQAGSLREIARANTAARGGSELLAAETGRPPPDTTSRDYLSAVDRFGSPAGGPAGVLEGDATALAFFDVSLIQSGLLKVMRSAGVGEACRVGPRELRLPDEGLLIAGVRGRDLSARRFSDTFTPVSPPGPGVLFIRPTGNQLVRPWFLRLPAGARVCG